eukprot:403334245
MPDHSETKPLNPQVQISKLGGVNNMPSKKQAEISPSTFAIIFANILYAVTSSGLTFINKALYRNYGFQSPLDLLLIQCLCNVLICTPMMIYKQFYPDSMQICDTLGMKVTPLNESIKKWKLGMRLGIFNLITVAFGIYSIKYVSIPLFLTFRRCSLLSTFVVTYYISRKAPNLRTYVKLGLVTLGAVVAGVDTFNRDWFGYMLIWMNNLSQSVTNVYFGIVNKDKRVSAFEINFFYAWVGLPLLTFYTIYTGEIYEFTTVMASEGAGIEDMNHKLNFFLLLVLSGSLGIVITMSTILVVTLCSPFMMNVNGNMKNAVSSVLGFMMFDEQIPSFNVVSGIIIGFAGSCLYAFDEYCSMKKSIDQQKKEEKETKKHN